MTAHSDTARGTRTSPSPQHPACRRAAHISLLLLTLLKLPGCHELIRLNGAQSTIPGGQEGWMGKKQSPFTPPPPAPCLISCNHFSSGYTALCFAQGQL